ncbi:hypothetical protein [Pontibacter burrus]|uniref:Uncharacterized protein n=1 Tax=Pontibacter burrus TaxID=2704466 RepID=A0A6B3LVC7_9BACT|nr:hypothetical protein [Pontibacter burrus]NEM98955.1 hypothetical protein [Pontibacter burrus]
MKTALLLFMFLIASGHAYSQKRAYLDVDSVVTVQAQELIESKKAMHVIVYQSGCVGCEVLREVDCNCDDDATAYLIWKEDSAYFKKKVGCCVKDEILPFGNAALYENLVKDSTSVFSSKFKSDYVEIHHSYRKIMLFSTGEEREVYMEEFLFAKDNKYKQLNLKQAAKAYSDKLESELFKK